MSKSSELISHDGPGHRWLASCGVEGIKLGLERVKTVLDRLGSPQTKVPVVLVAGTNGKGSTSALLAALLREAGLSVGHFTSPHLVETRERFRVGNRCVTAARLDEALCAVRDAAEQDVAITPFEAMTAAAYWMFQSLDVAVMEVGLGGRLDATNAADAEVAVVTQIARDHTAILGDTLAAIAAEKVAIARAGRPVVLSQPTITLAALRRAGLTCPVLKVGKDAEVTEVQVAAHGLGTSAVLRGRALEDPLHVEVSLPGRHQLDNAAAAVLAYHALRARWPSPLPSVLEVAWCLAEVPWPARLEVVDTQPLVVLDGAHNPAGARALVEALAHRGDRWQVMLSVRDNRDPEPLVRELGKIADTFWLPRMTSPRMRSAAELAAVVDACAPQANVAVGRAEACIAQARREAHRSSGVAVTGSLYGIGEWLGAGVIQSQRLVRWRDGDP